MRALSPMLQKILDAAEQEFGDKGLHGAKILSIAQSAGTSKQLIYHYFESKERLYEIVVSKRVRDCFEQLIAVEMERDEPVAAIGRFLGAFIDYLEQHSENIVLSIDQVLHNGAQMRADRELAATREVMLQRLAVPLAAGQALGLFKPGIDANMVFFLMTAFIVGALSLRPVFAKHDGRISETSPEGLRGLMRQFLLDALRA